MNVVALFCMMMANSPLFTSPVVTLAALLLLSISFGLGDPGSQAMLIDVTKPDEREAVYSVLFWLFNMAMAIGGIIGALTFKHHLFELLLGLLITSVIAAILVIFFIDETLALKTENLQKVEQEHFIIKMFKNYKVVLKDKLFMSYTLAILLITSLEFQLDYYTGVHLFKDMPTQSALSFDINGVNMLGFLRTENTIIVVLLSLLVTRWVTKLSDKSTYISSVIIYVIGYTVLSYADNIWLLFGFMFLATVGELMRVPTHSAIYASLPPEDKRSSYLAFNSLIIQFCMILGSWFVSLSAFLNNEAMSSLFLLTGMVGLFIIIKIFPDLQKKKELAAASGE
ncbi:MAG TPA: MFS transporter [Bacillales bacterium]|nr:MFS transporter [Bacillales bacterium]